MASIVADYPKVLIENASNLWNASRKAIGFDEARHLKLGDFGGP